MFDFDLDRVIAEIKAIEQSTKKRLSQQYGVDDVMKQYLGLPKWFPLSYLSYIDHGVPLFVDYIPDKLVRFKDIPLVSNSLYKNVLQTNIKQPVHIAGNAFVHYRNLNNIEPSPDRKGTLAFPAHSTHYLNSVADWEGYAQQLLDMPEAYQPVTICMYWKDLLREKHKVFIDAGIEVVTAGHFYNPDFMKDLYGFLSRVKYATGNTIGSHSFYALELGIPYFCYGPEIVYDVYDKSSTPRSAETTKKYEGDIKRVLSFHPNKAPVLEYSKVHEDLVNRYVDKKSWEDPKKLRSLLWRKLIPTLSSKAFRTLFKKK